MRKIFVLILVFGLILAACTARSNEPTMEGTPVSGTYPGPEQGAAATETGGAYPGVTQPVESEILPPQDGDDSLTRGEVFLESTQLLTQESTPPQYKLQISGSLPTPCHQLRAEVAAPDAAGKIVITVYSLIDPNQVCTQVLQPFSSNLALGSFTKGSYSVELNGVNVTAFDAP